MCKAPKPPKPKEAKKPEFLRNRYLDSTFGSIVGQIRQGRSSLRVPLLHSAQSSGTDRLPPVEVAPEGAVPVGVAPPPRVGPIGPRANRNPNRPNVQRR